jgi:hypothetical protein
VEKPSAFTVTPSAYCVRTACSTTV